MASGGPLRYLLIAFVAFAALAAPAHAATIAVNTDQDTSANDGRP
jgi:hypothetical protein